MPLALFVIGALFLTAAIRGTQGLLFSTLKDDFTGPGNFLYWGLSLFVIGSIGYYKPLRPISNSFMLLVFLILFISNKGFFNKFMQQISATQNSA
jgi:FtsH-binding integral membrane protein